jgi:hypothetical protein
MGSSLNLVVRTLIIDRKEMFHVSSRSPPLQKPRCSCQLKLSTFGSEVKKNNEGDNT